MTGFEFRALFLTLVLIAPGALADPLAEAFGAGPGLWRVRLSPDGTRISFLQVHSSDTPIAVVFDTRSGRTNLLLASDKGRFDIEWCSWASNERLLCGFGGMAKESRMALGRSSHECDTPVRVHFR